MIDRLGDYALAEVLQRVSVWDRARVAGTNRQFARVYAHMFRARDRQAALVFTDACAAVSCQYPWSVLLDA